MNIAKKAGMGFLRGVLAVVQTPARINYGYHSLRIQLKEAPLKLTMTRARQVITGESPMIRPLWSAEEILMAKLSLDNGVVEVDKLMHRSARTALEKQGIKRIVVVDFNPLLFGTSRARMILRQGAAGMQEGDTMIFCLNRWSPHPDFMSMARHGDEIRVVSRME